MIIVKYSGGLGNQMFQFAMSIVLKEKFPEEEIYADLNRYYLINEHDGFDIVKYFEIPITEVSGKINTKVAPMASFVNKFRFLKFIYGKKYGRIEKIDEFLEKKNNIGVIIDYYSTGFNDICFNLNRDFFSIWHFKGNWINPLYFKGCEELLINSFIFKESILSEEDYSKINEISNCESLGIHIRKGDYVSNYQFDLCKERYYQDSINLVRDKVCIDKIYIFCEEVINDKFLEGFDYEIISHPKQGGIDLWMMSKCKHNIIANSTFSYWAAFLNKNINKIVVAPQYAYRYKETLATLPVPAKWTQIKNI